MTSDEAIRTMSRLTRERNQGSLSIADYLELRARLLDELVGLSSFTSDAEWTRPQTRPTSQSMSGLVEGPYSGSPIEALSLLERILQLVRRIALRLFRRR
jgi:hypothetical protein